jgi:hypothetical protein
MPWAVDAEQHPGFVVRGKSLTPYRSSPIGALRQNGCPAGVDKCDALAADGIDA